MYVAVNLNCDKNMYGWVSEWGSELITVFFFFFFKFNADEPRGGGGSKKSR